MNNSPTFLSTIAKLSYILAHSLFFGLIGYIISGSKSFFGIFFTGLLLEKFFCRISLGIFLIKLKIFLSSKE